MKEEDIRKDERAKVIEEVVRLLNSRLNREEREVILKKVFNESTISRQ